MHFLDNRREFIMLFDAWWRHQLPGCHQSGPHRIASRNHDDCSSLLAWSRSRSCGTARLALEDNGQDSSALLWTFLRERPEGSGRELFAFCCPYRFFIDAQTKARTKGIWCRDRFVMDCIVSHEVGIKKRTEDLRAPRPGMTQLPWKLVVERENRSCRAWGRSASGHAALTRSAGRLK